MHLLAELIALLAPPGCLACGRALARADERLCVECVRALPWLRAGCPRCGLPKHRGRRCPAAGAAFERAWAPMAYEGVARRLVAGLKFRGALVVADLMAAHIAANLPPGLRDPAVALVPVPAARARRRARGFDPARVLDARPRPPARPPLRRLPRPPRSRGPPGRHRPPRAPRTRPPPDPRPRLTAAARDPRRRRPHHGRDARRLRPRPDGRGNARDRGDQLRPHPVTRGVVEKVRIASVCDHTRCRRGARRATRRPAGRRGEGRAAAATRARGAALGMARACWRGEGACGWAREGRVAAWRGGAAARRRATSGRVDGAMSR